MLLCLSLHGGHPVYVMVAFARNRCDKDSNKHIPDTAQGLGPNTAGPVCSEAVGPMLSHAVFALGPCYVMEWARDHLYALISWFT